MAQLTRPEDYLAGGLDTRNYGELAGIPEARALFAEILGCRAEQVFVGGNGSLQLMYDAISKARIPMGCSTARSRGASWRR